MQWCFRDLAAGSKFTAGAAPGSDGGGAGASSGSDSDGAGAASDGDGGGTGALLRAAMAMGQGRYQVAILVGQGRFQAAMVIGQAPRVWFYQNDCGCSNDNLFFLVRKAGMNGNNLHPNILIEQLFNKH